MKSENKKAISSLGRFFTVFFLVAITAMNQALPLDSGIYFKEDFIGTAFNPSANENNTMEKWMEDHTLKVQSTTTYKYEQGYLLIEEIYTGEELKERFGVEQLTKELKIPAESKAVGMKEGEEKVFVTEKVTVLTSENDPPPWRDNYNYPQWTWHRVDWTIRDGWIYEYLYPINLAWRNVQKCNVEAVIEDEDWRDYPIAWPEYVYDREEGWIEGDGMADRVVGPFGRDHVVLWQMSDGNVVANAHRDSGLPDHHVPVYDFDEVEKKVADYFYYLGRSEWRVYENSYYLCNRYANTKYIKEGEVADGWCTQITEGPWPAIWYVDDDGGYGVHFTEIQTAINTVIDGDTLIVKNGIYKNVIVNKSITLRGEDRDNTIIDGCGNGDVVKVIADGCEISGFTVQNSGTYDAGIYLYYSDNNILTHNNASNNGDGISLHFSSNNIITGNTVSNNNDDGIILSTSSNNNIVGNMFVNDGLFVLDSYQNTVEDNTVNGKPLVYLEDTSDIEVTDAGQVILVNCNNITVENLALSNTSVGVELWTTEDSMISNNNVSNNRDGIYLYSFSNNNTIIGNTASNNGDDGIFLHFSSNNTITGNNVHNNDDGIYLSLSRSNTITGNNVHNNADGIYLSSSSNNTITGNNVSSNDYGIYLPYFVFGIYSFNNKIYLNNFINNTDNVYSYNSTNIWNSTEKITYTYSGSEFENYLGNYWDDYEGSDTDGNGIGDTPYSINSDNDNYPLMDPWENYFVPTVIFDTGSPANPYPSISGTHNCTITPFYDLNVSKLYTYPCSGTGGHTEYAEIRNATWNATATWEGYVGDWHNITFDKTVVLVANETYNYTIKTGSYPQIIHEPSKEITGGTITCTSFEDANGKVHTDWIPAIKLF